MLLKELRVSSGLRQIDVAQELDVDQAAVSKWESGETRPSRKYHARLARLYGISDTALQTALAETNTAREED